MRPYCIRNEQRFTKDVIGKKNSNLTPVFSLPRQANVTVREAVGAILGGLQRCCLVVDEDNLLEGIMTLTDLELEAQRAAQAVAQGEMEPLDVSEASFEVSGVAFGYESRAAGGREERRGNRWRDVVHELRKTCECASMELFETFDSVFNKPRAQCTPAMCHSAKLPATQAPNFEETLKA